MCRYYLYGVLSKWVMYRIFLFSENQIGFDVRNNYKKGEKIAAYIKSNWL